MKKLPWVLALGLLVSGIGGCGDDAPVPRPDAGPADGGAKGDGEASDVVAVIPADGAGSGSDTSGTAGVDAGTGALDAPGVADLAPDAGGGNLDAQGVVDGPVVVSVVDGGGPVDGPVVVGVADG